MATTKYSELPIGKIFEAKGTKYRKMDELYYEDITTGFQSVWNPMFDDSINAPAVKPVADKDNTKDKFLVDQQTRMVTPNPNYRECDGSAERVFAEMAATGEYDVPGDKCSPDAYDYMGMCSVPAVGAMRALGKIVGLDGSAIIMFPAIVDSLTVAYEEYKKNHAKNLEGDVWTGIVKLSKRATAAKKAEPAKKPTKKLPVKTTKPAKKKGTR